MANWRLLQLGSVGRTAWKGAGWVRRVTGRPEGAGAVVALRSRVCRTEEMASRRHGREDEEEGQHAACVLFFAWPCAFYLAWTTEQQVAGLSGCNTAFCSPKMAHWPSRAMSFQLCFGRNKYRTFFCILQWINTRYNRGIKNLGGHTLQERKEATWICTGESFKSEWEPMQLVRDILLNKTYLFPARKNDWAGCDQLTALH